VFKGLGGRSKKIFMPTAIKEPAKTNNPVHAPGDAPPMSRKYARHPMPITMAPNPANKGSRKSMGRYVSAKASVQGKKFASVIRFTSDRARMGEHRPHWKVANADALMK
jgi:hypothetical protein